MTECTATLTTATWEDCPQKGTRANFSCSGENCIPGAFHVTPHTIKCERPHPHRGDSHADLRGTLWTDDTRGATPHKPPLVSDAEVEAAQAAYRAWTRGRAITDLGARTMLEAAAKVRMEQRGV